MWENNIMLCRNKTHTTHKWQFATQTYTLSSLPPAVYRWQITGQGDTKTHSFRTNFMKTASCGMEDALFCAFDSCTQACACMYTALAYCWQTILCEAKLSVCYKNTKVQTTARTFAGPRLTRESVAYACG